MGCREITGIMRAYQPLLRLVGRSVVGGVVASIILLAGAGAAFADPDTWRYEWKRTDFTKHSVDLDEIISGGPPKDGIPSIDSPSFAPVKNVVGKLKATEPVIAFTWNGEAKAYPLGILMRHEIVNDIVGGKHVTVTYCPLCNAAVVFDATFDGRAHEFGTTGKLRNSDLVMYDRTTESWWQQFLGEAIVGAKTGTRLTMLPSRLESFARFAKRFPKGKVLLPASPFMPGFGSNPYVGYDTARMPFLYRGDMPEGIPPLARVVAVGDEAWSLELLRREKKIVDGDIVLTWERGQNSALDTHDISKGRDVGNVVVQRKTAAGLQDVVHDVVFAFVFHAFRPAGVIHHVK
jgi:hypothetical protein